ncbi:restriction endonuclease subunit S [Streptomyces sp. NPDC048680]|uniref:restriction endonuclease subunit S n=1 Tax=Streptomyces sp. NPDC048680 TaxID=3155492 RepID=UPI00342B9E86
MKGAFGGIPKHWQLTRVDRVASVNARIGWKALTAAEYQEDGYAFLATPNIKSAEIDFENVNFISEFRYEESPDLKLATGDVLLAKDGNTLGIVNIVRDLPRPATVNGSIAVLRAHDVDPNFLRYVIASDITQSAISAVKDGMGVPHLFQRDINRLAVPLPSAEEQRRISRFLDVQIGHTDDVIAKRTRQLALLGERELSAVFHAVRGASQSGQRKGSGLAWMGSVPEAWAVAAVSHHYEVLLGKMLNQERVEGEYLRPYLRNTNVQWDRIATHDLLRMNFPPGERSRYEVRAGDLLICEGGEPGRSAIWRGEVGEIYYQKALHRARPRGESSVRWLYYCMRAATALNVFAVEGNTTTIAHLTGEQLRVLRFPFPPREVQDQITSELDEEVRSLRDLANRVGEQLDLLAERRSALITAAVTGQIDVTTARGVRVP